MPGTLFSPVDVLKSSKLISDQRSYYTWMLVIHVVGVLIARLVTIALVPTPKVVAIYDIYCILP